jgi:hypothetical protein
MQTPEPLVITQPQSTRPNGDQKKPLFDLAEFPPSWLNDPPVLGVKGPKTQPPLGPGNGGRHE